MVVDLFGIQQSVAKPQFELQLILSGTLFSLQLWGLQTSFSATLLYTDKSYLHKNCTFMGVGICDKTLTCS